MDERKRLEARVSFKLRSLFSLFIPPLTFLWKFRITAFLYFPSVPHVAINHCHVPAAEYFRARRYLELAESVDFIDTRNSKGGKRKKCEHRV